MPKMKGGERKLHIFFAIHSLLLFLVGAILVFSLIRI
jgi:Sec-independent protein secretion pathway component TatC